MYELLQDIKDGTYAQGWIEENQKGRPWFNQQRQAQQNHMIEQVGADLREMMPFIDPVTIKPGE
jgi:ketol-acid reductoisomerase